MNSALMFSRKSDEWETPESFYGPLCAEFGFDIDVAADEDNRKCVTYLSAGMDALRQSWDCGVDRPTVAWCNPPYSQCREFVAKAADERRKGVLTVMLVPARTDTRWFHEHLWDSRTHRPQTGIELRFVKGRLKFGDGKNSAPFPSMVVVFRP